MINLSLIIPTRNRAETLCIALKSIENQTLDQSIFEVIICDNDSSDNTEEVALSFANKFKNFKYIKTLEPGLHVGRNKGFKEAKGDILVYIDDDIEAFPEWLYTINAVFKDKDVALVGGKNFPKWEVDPPDWALKMWEPNKNKERISGSFSIIDLGNQIKEINPHYVYGCNFSVRKGIITETKGFHPDGMPQEIIEYRGDGESAVCEFIKQKGYKAIYHPKASVYHLVSKERLTLNYLKKRSFNQGVSDSYTSIRKLKQVTPSKAVSVKSVFKKVLRRLRRFLIYKPIETGTKRNPYHNAMAEGHQEGYNFHQQKVKTNLDLKLWVMKDNYL